MEFSFSEEQELLRRTVREFAEKEIAPRSAEWDERENFPIEALRKLGELGMLGTFFPPEYGGAGLSYLDYIIEIEELARIDPAVALSVSAHTSLCSNHIYMFGNEEQKRKFLTPLASGKKLGAWSLTEPEAGSDAGGTRTVARRQGDYWVLNGSKTFTTHGTFADIYVVMAATDPSRGRDGISAFIIERGTPGLIVGRREQKLGMRASDTASVILEDCRVPAANLLGVEGRGYRNALEVLDGGRIGIGALSVGLAQGAFERALRYSVERRQFGKPIAEFQAIRFKLADMATDIEAARLLVYRAAWLRQNGKRVTKYASMAKTFASEAAVRVAEEAIQIHGGYGYIKEYGVEKLWRDSKLLTIGEGTNEIQRLVIASQLLAEQGYGD